MPQIKCNLHTHTQFCDGRDSMENMVKTAIEKGFETLGFSPHSYTPFCLDYCIKDFDAEAAEFLRLKNLYADKICLLNGIELDYYGEMPKDAKLDFVIGSVHYVRNNGVFYGVDDGKEDFLRAVELGFDGNVISLAESYFSTLAKMAKTVRPDVIGHFDLITLYGDFSACESKYKDSAFCAAEEVAKSGSLVEINAGRLFKGKGGLYPDDFLLKYMAQKGMEFILSSDAHCVDALGFKFDEITQKLKNLGIKYLTVFDKNGKKHIKI